MLSGAGGVYKIRQLPGEMSNVDLFHLRTQDCLSNSLRAIELGRLADDLYTQVSGHLDAARASTLLGELGVAIEYAASSLLLAEKLGGRFGFLEPAHQPRDSGRPGYEYRH